MQKPGHIKKNDQSEVLKEAISKVIFLYLITSGHSKYHKYDLFNK